MEKPHAVRRWFVKDTQGWVVQPTYGARGVPLDTNLGDMHYSSAPHLTQFCFLSRQKPLAINVEAQKSRCPTLLKEPCHEEVNRNPEDRGKCRYQNSDIGEDYFGHEGGHERLLVIEKPLRLVREGPLVE